MNNIPLIQKVVGNLTNEEVARLFIARFELPWEIWIHQTDKGEKLAIEVVDETGRLWLILHRFNAVKCFVRAQIMNKLLTLAFLEKFWYNIIKR